jgi:hypothetical protein
LPDSETVAADRKVELDGTVLFFTSEPMPPIWSNMVRTDCSICARSNVRQRAIATVEAGAAFAALIAANASPPNKVRRDGLRLRIPPSWWLIVPDSAVEHTSVRAIRSRWKMQR